MNDDNRESRDSREADEWALIAEDIEAREEALEAKYERIGWTGGLDE